MQATNAYKILCVVPTVTDVYQRHKYSSRLYSSRSTMSSMMAMLLNLFMLECDNASVGLHFFYIFPTVRTYFRRSRQPQYKRRH
jgi:hypothetical protein